MSDLKTRLGWTMSLALGAALIVAGCDTGEEQEIEVVEPSPSGVPSTDMGEMPPMSDDYGTQPDPADDAAPADQTIPEPADDLIPADEPTSIDPPTDEPAPADDPAPADEPAPADVPVEPEPSEPDDDNPTA